MWRKKSKQADTAATPRCTFCGKPHSQVEQFIAGPGVSICSACVDLCQQIIQRKREGWSPVCDLPR